MSKSRFPLLLISTLFLSAACTPGKSPLIAPPASARCEGCNIIVVSIDSLRSGHLGLYGYKRPTSPNIDAWGAKSLVFENYFSTSYLTPISEASVHTGLYPETNGVIGFRSFIGDNVPTLGERLKGAGYETGAFGNSPEFIVHESLRKSFSRGFDHYEIKQRFDNGRRLDLPRIEKFIREAKKPFFLWVPMGAAHAPFGQGAKPVFDDPEYRGPFRAVQFFANMQFYFDGWLYDLTSPKWKFRLFEVKENIPTHAVKEKLDRKKWPIRVQPADIQYMVDLYDNGVLLADEEFQRIVDAVSRAGISGKTVIVLQSQHGETLGEHGYIAHYDIWDDSTHVPWIMSSPAIKDPARVPHLASGVDVLPTLLDHLGIPVKERVDGLSFFKDYPATGVVGKVRNEVFLTRTPLWESILRIEGSDTIFDRFRALDDKAGYKDYAIRTLETKLIHRRARLMEERFSAWTYVTGKKIRRSEFEAYDLVKDPGEQKTITELGPSLNKLRVKLLEFEKEMSVRAVRTGLESTIQDYR